MLQLPSHSPADARPRSAPRTQKGHAEFGRQCRGQGRVFVKLVRQTERQLLELGQPIPVLGRQAQQLLEETETLPAVQRERLTRQLRSALAAQAQIRKQSGRLTQGKKLGHCKLVNAYDLTIAPILKGKSNCPAQFRNPASVCRVGFRKLNFGTAQLALASAVM